MTKRILTLLLAFLLVLSLGACKNPNQDDPPNGDDPPSGDQAVVADFDGLKAEIGFLIEKGDERADAMFDRQAIFYYSVAAAHVTALRYVVLYESTRRLTTESIQSISAQFESNRVGRSLFAQSTKIYEKYGNA